MTPDERKAKRTEYARKWRAANPDKVNTWRRENREAYNAYQRAYRAAHPEIAREAEKRQREKDLEGRRAQLRKSTYKRLYGITPEDYDRMFAEQGGVCRICGDPPVPPKRLHVDHSHRQLLNPTRGLICFRCNSGLGMFRDDPALLVKAAEYLNQAGAGAGT